MSTAARLPLHRTSSTTSTHHYKMGKKKQSKQPLEPEVPAATAAVSGPFAVSKSGASFDSELDAFFKTPAVTPPQPASSASTRSSKRKAASQPSSSTSSAKKAKAAAVTQSDSNEEPGQPSELDSDADEDEEELGQLSEPDSDEQLPSDSDSDDDQDDKDAENVGDSTVEALEVEYHTRTAQQQALPEVDSDGDELPVHESLASSKGKSSSSSKSKKKKKLFAETDDETPEEQERRTLFIGNVTVEAVKSRSLQKQLRKLIEESSPYPSVTRVSSLRFRSIAFAVPTDDFSGESSKAKADRRKERSQNYREAVAAVDGKPEGSHDFLNPKQKRKVAYINQQLNTHADTVNAYVTLAHPDAVFNHYNRDGAGNFDERLTGPVLTALVASSSDGRLFENHHLRVDMAKPLEPAEVLSAGLDKATGPDGSLLLSSSTGGSNDPKRTVFVGNLDFEAKEEDLRAFFEKLLTAERGPAPSTSVDVLGLDGKAPVQPFGETVVPAPVERREWVRSVRIVRDRATQMGKGFAYVRFIDTESVDEVVALHDAEKAFLDAAKAIKPQGGGGGSFRRKFKFQGRPLRVSRCKAGGQASTQRPRSLPTKAQPAKAKAKAKSFTPAPKLSETEIKERAEMLSKLGKEDRAAVKRSDKDRQARRMEKKLAKQAAERVARAESSAKTKVKTKSKAGPKSKGKAKAKKGQPKPGKK